MGDSDRIGVVDAAGRMIWGDELLVLYSRDVLSRNPNAIVVSEVKCSQRLYDDIAKHGGKPVVWKTGHSLIKAKMKEEKALLAGTTLTADFAREQSRKSVEGSDTVRRIEAGVGAQDAGHHRDRGRLARPLQSAHHDDGGAGRDPQHAVGGREDLRRAAARRRSI